MVCHYRIPQRFTDLNACGEVDHAALADYLQEARTELLLGSEEPMRSMLGGGVLVTAHWIDCLAPVGFDGREIDAQVWIDQVGAARFSISYRFLHEDLPVLQARTFLVPYDLRDGALRRLTDAEREQLEVTLADPVPLQSLGKLRPAELDDLDHVVTRSVRVRWGDLDAYGHVNNVKFFDYLSDARRDLLDDPQQWVVSREDLDYRLPIDFRREPYAVRTRQSAADDASRSFAADIIDPADGRCFATGRAVLVRRDTNS